MAKVLVKTLKLSKTHEDCITNVMRKTYLATYDCIPPWFPRSHETTGNMLSTIQVFIKIVISKDS